jgi:hypothetical protein
MDKLDRNLLMKELGDEIMCTERENYINIKLKLAI